MSYLSTSFMLYSFTTMDPAVVFLSGTCIDSIFPEGKFESAVRDISNMGWYNYTMIIHIVPVVHMAWVSASSCHPFKGDISRDKSNDLTVLFLEKYRKTSHMIWRCSIHWDIGIRVRWFECVIILAKYRKTSHMIWRCPIHWEISKYESDDLNAS